jgi:uncharacterized membrane protein YkvA (DUF1232 family)
MKALLLLLPNLAVLLGRLLRDPGVPRTAKKALGAMAGYLASPVDLIPDFIPFVGYLDDAILVALILDGLPEPPRSRNRAQALARRARDAQQERGGGPPPGRVGPCPGQGPGVRGAEVCGRTTVSNWGRWGPEDEIGPANFIAPENVFQATRLVKKGQVLSLAIPLNPRTPTDPSRPPMQHFVRSPRLKVSDHGWGGESRVRRRLDLHGAPDRDPVGRPRHAFKEGGIYNGYDAGQAINPHSGARKVLHRPPRHPLRDAGRAAGHRPL